MKRQKQVVQNAALKCDESQPIAFDKNVEELLNHLGDLIGEILITEILNPKNKPNKENDHEKYREA